MQLALSMIVRNETPVLTRCLHSVLPHVSSAVIIDTGSTDGTRQLASQLLLEEAAKRPSFRVLPVQRSEWKDFATNRNEALAIARHIAPYVLTIDADEELFGGAELAQLEPDPKIDGIYLPMHSQDMRYDRLAIVRSDSTPAWRWEGKVHETFYRDQPPTLLRIRDPRIYVVARKEGYRSRDPNAYQKDAELLRQSDQNDPRNVYYLGQALHAAGDLEQALETLLKRARMRNGWEEERWHAIYTAAQIVEKLKQPSERVQSAYLQAYQSRPSRPEPLIELARHLSETEQFALATIFAVMAASMPPTTDLLFVEKGRWRALDYGSVAAHYSGQHELAKRLFRELQKSEFPEEHRARIAENAKHIL